MTYGILDSRGHCHLLKATSFSVQAIKVIVILTVTIHESIQVIDL